MTPHARHRLVNVFPSSDAALLRHTATVLRNRVFRSPRELEVRLRRLYPSLTVREQADLGRVGPLRKWYVFRDGFAWPGSRDDWSPAEGGGDRTFAFDPSGRIVEANAEADALCHVPAGGLVGHYLRELGPPQQTRDAIRLWREMAARGELDPGAPPVESTVTLICVEGEVCPIRYRITWDAEPGLFRMVARRTDPPPAPTARERARHHA